MPAKNRLKTYVEGAYYHIYNRGVEQREIFLDDADYKTFIYNFRRYLEPGFLFTALDFRTKKPVLVTPNQVISKVDLLGFCLMPNHFHLLIKLKTKDGMTDFLRKVCTNYTTYFNNKYSRVGGLFQGIYKAVLVESEEQLNNLSRYIHLNPKEIVGKGKLCDYEFSSFYYICRKKEVSWLNYNDILGESSSKSYEKFVLDALGKETETLKYPIKDISLD